MTEKAKLAYAFWKNRWQSEVWSAASRNFWN